METLTKRYPLIAREGWAIITVLAGGAVLSGLAWGATAALWCGAPALVAAVWFRDPLRVAPSLPLAIVSPVHGRVTHTEDCRDPWLERDARRVEIWSGPFQVHSLFCPIEGKIQQQWSDARSGRFTYALWIRTDEGDDVVLALARGALPGPLNIRHHPGERVGHGRRLGFAWFGCRAAVYTAATSQFEVAPGDRVNGAASVVGMLVHRTRMARRGGGVIPASTAGVQ